MTFFLHPPPTTFFNFLHNFISLQVGRVEDVVVSDEYRGRQLGKFSIVIVIVLLFLLLCNYCGLG